MLKKIDINGTALRILTLACYFLPFVFCFTTCVDGVGRTAYNRQDAIANEKDKVIAEKKDLLEAAANLVADKLTVGDTSIETTSETIKILQDADNALLINPTFTSLSAIGFVLMFDNVFPRVLIAISALISLLCLILWRLISKKKFGTYVVGANLLFVLGFVVFCFATNVTVLYGAYTLAFLLLVQLLSVLQHKQKEIDPALGSINPN